MIPAIICCTIATLAVFAGILAIACVQPQPTKRNTCTRDNKDQT